MIKLNQCCNVFKLKRPDFEENLSYEGTPIEYLKDEEVIETEGASLK